jgi:radical SAM superfamily enzyme YgiQ (UPF0313 family)
MIPSAEKDSDQSIDVLLTYPSDPVRLFDSMVPLGLASIAAVLEANSYKVKVIDFNHYKGDFRKDQRTWQPKIVGIGGTTATRQGSFLTARLTREVLPTVPVVYGGPHASFTARDTLTHVLEIDYVVKGEGEYPFLALCDHFIRHAPVDIEKINGLCYRTTNNIAENPCVRIDNLDALPLPARHLFGGRYRQTLDIFNNLDAEFLLTSRGCPAHCTFCSASRMFGGGVRYRSMENIKAELDSLIKTKKMEALKLFDSTFTSSHDHVAAFCDMIGPYNILWECEVRADTLDRRMLANMKQAGCVYINVGLETSNKTLLARAAKNISTEQVENALGWCREVGIRTKVFMIFGHAGQTFDECKQDIAYINKHRDKIDFFATTVGMRVYPGTPLETMVKKNQGMPADFSWVRYKSPLKNLLLCEMGDVFILSQPGLGFVRLFLVIVLLAKQKTLTSGAYLMKMLAQNAGVYLDRLLTCFIHFQHRVTRMMDQCKPQLRHEVKNISISCRKL